MKSQLFLGAAAVAAPSRTDPIDGCAPVRLLSKFGPRAAGGYERAAFVQLNKEMSEFRTSLAAVKPAT